MKVTKKYVKDSKTTADSVCGIFKNEISELTASTIRVKAFDW